MKTRQMRRRFYYGLAVFVLAGSMVCLVVTRSRRPPVSPISIKFTGEIGSGIHLNPFGQFVLSNQSKHPLRWSRASVDAPQDADLGWSASVDSKMWFGEIPAGASTNFPALVPRTKGQRFRLLVRYAAMPSTIEMLRTKLPAQPWLDRIWPRDYRWRTLTSQWFYAPEDYKRP